MEYKILPTSADLLSQLNNLPSPSAVDPHTTSSMSSENTLSNPFESEKTTTETSSSLPSDDKIKSIMSMYPGNEPKAQEPTSWRPPNTYPSLDSWPTYQVSPKPEPKSLGSPATSPMQSRTEDNIKSPSETQSQTTPSYTVPQYPPYTSPRTETRNEQTATTSYAPQTTYQTQQPASGYSSPSSYTQASTNHVVQYSVQAPYTPQTSSATTPNYQTPSTVQSPQTIMNQIEKLQQQNAQQQQALQQHFSQQLQMQKQLLAFQQTEAVTKDFVEKMQASFSKIMGFMESVDQRLSNLEKVTQSILHNQNNPTPAPPTTTTTSTPTVMPHPPTTVFPSYAVPLGPTVTYASGSVYPTIQTADEADAVRKIEQFEEDQKLAKRLQEELELEAKRPTPSKSTASTTTTKKPTTTPKKDEELVVCPICSTQISLSEIETHADQCLESSGTTKKDSNGAVTPQEKAGFFAKLFGSKDTPTPTPTPTPVATKPSTTPTVTATATTTKPATTTTAPTATVAHMPATMPTAFQPGPSNPNGQAYYQVPYPMYNTAYAPYGYSQYPPPGTTGQQGYYYYPGQQPTAQPPKKN